MTGTKHFDKSERKARILAAAVVGGGCAAAATQIIVLRECLALFYGSELTVGLVLFFWLSWTGLGSVMGARLCPKLFPALPARLRFVLILVVLYGLLLPLTVLWVRVSRSLFHVELGELVPLEWTVMVIGAVTAPVCNFFGIFFGSAWFVYHSFTAPPQVNSRLYALEALGSAFGGLWLYGVLAWKLPLLYGAAWLGGALAAFGFWALAVQAPRGRPIWHGFLAFATICAIFATGLLEESSRRRQWGPSVVAVVDTPYHNTALLHQGSLWSLMADGLWLFSYPDPQTVESEVHLAMLQHGEPQRILALGSLSPETLQEILRYPTIRKVDVVDPAATLAFFADMVKGPGTERFREDPRVSLWEADIRRFVETAESSYDVVLLSSGDPFSLSTNRFYTQEFYGSVARILRPGGLFSFAVSGAEDMLGDTQAAYFQGVMKTLRSVFPYCVIYPGERIRLVASREPGRLSEEPKVLSDRAGALGLTLQYLRPDRLQNLLDPFRLAYFRSFEDPDDHNGINRDLDPVGFVAASRLWAAQFRPGDRAFMDRPSAFLWTLIAATALILALWSAAVVFGRSAGAAVAGAVGAMGAAQMAFQVLLLFLYQIVVGALYAHMTVLVSVCMAGLSLGAFGVRSLVGAKRGVLGSPRGFLGVHAAATLFLGGIFLLLRGGGLAALHLWPSWAVLCFFGALAFLGGGLGGAHFASGCLLGQRVGLSPGAVGGVLYGIDLLGAATAAVTTSLMLVPLLGVPRVFLAYGGMLSFAWFMSWIALRRV